MGHQKMMAAEVRLRGEEIMKVLWMDCETSGVDPVRHEILQIAGIIEIEGKEVETRFFDRPAKSESVGRHIEPTHQYCRFIFNTSTLA